MTMFLIHLLHCYLSFYWSVQHHVFFNSWDSAFKVLKWLLYGLLTQGSNTDFLEVKRNLLRLFRGTLNLIKNDIQNQRVPPKKFIFGDIFLQVWVQQGRKS